MCLIGKKMDYATLLLFKWKNRFSLVVIFQAIDNKIKQ